MEIDGRAITDALAGGDTKAVEMLYEKYESRLYGYLISMLGAEWAAQDAMQEVFLGLVRNHERLGGIEKMENYLFTAARNAAYMVLRERRNAPGSLPENAPIVAPVDKGRREEAEELSAALLGLPVEQREVVVLKIYQDMTFEQIAAVTGESQNTVASRLRYAMEKLREILRGRL
jgi:RNA polymerase sigma-70 factor (ECF subfamily)